MGCQGLYPVSFFNISKDVRLHKFSGQVDVSYMCIWNTITIMQMVCNCTVVPQLFACQLITWNGQCRAGNPSSYALLWCLGKPKPWSGPGHSDLWILFLELEMILATYRIVIFNRHLLYVKRIDNSSVLITESSSKTLCYKTWIEAWDEHYLYSENGKQRFLKSSKQREETLG